MRQLCVDTGCSQVDQPEAINDRDEWRERSNSELSTQLEDDDDYNDDIYIYVYTYV